MESGLKTVCDFYCMFNSSSQLGVMQLAGIFNFNIHRLKASAFLPIKSNASNPKKTRKHKTSVQHRPVLRTDQCHGAAAHVVIKTR